MTRMLFSFCLWVVVARWAYSEVQLVCPPLVPYINKALAAVEIPTHDKWPKEQILKVLTSAVAEFNRSES
jgi:hypothetical protein